MCVLVGRGGGRGGERHGRMETLALSGMEEEIRGHFKRLNKTPRRRRERRDIGTRVWKRWVRIRANFSLHKVI